jgi:Domain of unknown function (DUF4129)
MAAAIRPRGPAESIDLGFRMVREWWRPVYGAWLVAVLPVYVIAGAGLERWPWQTFLCLWWLRPLFDRVPLFVLSRCLFGAPPSWRQTLRALPGLWRRHLAGALTWRRFDPGRSFHLPVWQLERLRRRERRARLRLLVRGCRRQALGLTAGCLLLEASVLVGLFGLLHMMLPQPDKIWKAIFETSVPDPMWVKLIWFALFFLAGSAIAPFYAGAGFALYLGQRTRFEGWDIEIALRCLAARLAAVPAMARQVAPSLLLAVAMALAALGPALATPPPPPPPAPAGASMAAGTGAASGAAGARPGPLGRQVRTAVAAVLREPEFQTEDLEIHWVPRSPGARAAAASDWAWLRLPRLPRLPHRVKLGLVAAAGVGVLAYVLLRWRRVWLLPARQLAGTDERPAARHGAPGTVVGLDVRPSSLPADVPAAAWQLWEAGEAAAALSLLYRASLAALMTRTTLRFAESWTEGDCLRAVRRHAAAGGTAAGGGDAELFARLTASWQAAAYGRREPDGLAMRDLCAGWRQAFGDGAAAAGGGARGAA